MKITIRYFSIGLLTASIVLFIMYLIIDDTSQAIEDFSVEELTTALEEKGYRTITQDEFISYSVYLDEIKEAEESKKEEEKENRKSSSKKNDEKKVEKEESNKEKDTKKEENNSSEKKKEEKKEEKKPKTFTVTVKQGSVSQDIGKELEKEGIIKDAAEFVKYMEDNNYSSRIQIGKFKVNSDMSLKELAETLTTYPGS